MTPPSDKSPAHTPLVGFTLIELLVVMTILSVLVALLLPSLIRAKQATRRIACVSNVKQILLGSMLYADENDRRLPPYSATSSCYYLPGYWYSSGTSNNNGTHQIAHGGSGYGVKPFFTLLWTRYLGDPRLFYCANAQSSYPTNWSGSVWGKKSSYYFDYLVRPSFFGTPYKARSIATADSKTLLIGEPTKATAASPHANSRTGEEEVFWSGEMATGGTHGYADGHALFLFPGATGYALRWDFRF